MPDGGCLGGKVIVVTGAGRGIGTSAVVTLCRSFTGGIGTAGAVACAAGDAAVCLRAGCPVAGAASVLAVLGAGGLIVGAVVGAGAFWFSALCSLMTGVDLEVASGTGTTTAGAAAGCGSLRGAAC